ncbi:MAG: NAD(P)-binding protein [Bacteroidia bacterium]
MHNTIIGAGPAGLAVAGRLRRLGQDFSPLEKATGLLQPGTAIMTASTFIR